MRVYDSKVLILGAAYFFAGIGLAFGADAQAVIKPTTPESQVRGSVSFQETEKGLHIKAALSGLPQGRHGFHVHEKGDCSDAGNAAGGHYNPDASAHGYLPKDGFKQAHAGDFGNLSASESGEAGLDMIVPKLTLTGSAYNISGKALIVHEKEDDFGQPTGNAGGRIACGVIEPIS